MDSTHKHRKGFREDQVVLSEAYTSIYNEEIGGDFKLSGQFHPSQEQVIKKHIMNLVNYVTDNNIKPTQPALADAMAKVAPTMVSWFRTQYGLSNLARDVLSAMGNAEDYEMMEGEEGELSDDYTNPNYRGDPHDFQPGEIIEVGPWGPNDEADHLEVVLQVNDDGVVNTVPITDDAYGVQYGGNGGKDISLIRPQSELELDSQEQFTPMEFPSDEEY